MKLVGERYVEEFTLDPSPDTLSTGPDHVLVRPSRWLVGALVTCLVALACLGVALYQERRQSETERRVTQVVIANLDAWNAHDTAAVLGTMTPYSAVSVVGMPGQQAPELYQGEDLVDYLDFLLREEAGFVGIRTGAIAITRSGAFDLAAMPVHVHVVDLPNQPTSELDCLWSFVLVERDGELKVFRHYPWRCASLPATQRPG